MVACTAIPMVHYAVDGFQCCWEFRDIGNKKLIIYCFEFYPSYVCAYIIFQQRDPSSPYQVKERIKRVKKSSFIVSKFRMELGGLKITDCSDVLVKQREISSLSLIAVNKF